MKDNNIYNDLIHKESFFWTPDYVDISAWIEHIPFAFWIVETLKPKRIVELGAHNGVSYFSFCQGVKSLNINTVCYAVDTWYGDEHSGFYGPEVYDKVVAHNTSHFSRFSTLIRSTFDEAVDYFIDKSIDLLHIDGLHTYTAVKHDFETWLPKLSPNAIIIFHDINVRERNFGVFKFWEELKATYSNVQFDFGHGLGIISLGNGMPGELKMLFDKKDSSELFIFLRNFFSEKGSALKARFENLTALNNQKNHQAEEYKSLQAQYQLLKEGHTALETRNNQLNETYQVLVKAHEDRSSELHLLKTNLASQEHKCVELNEQFSKLVIDNNSLKKENELLKKSLLSQEQRFAELNELFSKILIDNSGLRDENDAVKKNLAWYKATFEERSIAGILKEKLKKSFK